MSKDFNIYKWRRDYLAESVLKEEQDNLFAQGWEEKIKPKADKKDKTEDGKDYTHIINNAPEKQLGNIKKVAEEAGYNYVDHDSLPIGGRNSRIKIYFTKK